ncbi:MAG: hypothetical protein IT279_06655 [Ignavibacteriaceae bacterium]|nr:hypothetical protein [Ignavibacteriaceae bacterium]
MTETAGDFLLIISGEFLLELNPFLLAVISGFIRHDAGGLPGNRNALLRPAYRYRLN